MTTKQGLLTFLIFTQGSPYQCKYQCKYTHTNRWYSDVERLKAVSGIPVYNGHIPVSQGFSNWECINFNLYFKRNHIIYLFCTGDTAFHLLCNFTTSFISINRSETLVMYTLGSILPNIIQPRWTFKGNQEELPGKALGL